MEYPLGASTLIQSSGRGGSAASNIRDRGGGSDSEGGDDDGDKHVAGKVARAGHDLCAAKNSEYWADSGADSDVMLVSDGGSDAIRKRRRVEESKSDDPHGPPAAKVLMSSRITTPFNPFVHLLSGKCIEAAFASIYELALASLSSLLGRNVSNDQRMEICKRMLASVDRNKLPQAGVLSQGVIGTLGPRRCMHEDAVHWLLYTWTKACDITAVFDSDPCFECLPPKGQLCPLRYGPNKGRVVVLGGTLMDMFRDSEPSNTNPTLRTTKRYLDALEGDHIGLSIYYGLEHFISMDLDLRANAQAKVSSRNSLGNLFPKDLETRIRAVLKHRAPGQQLVVKNVADAEQESLECGPRSMQNLFDDALAISNGSQDVFCLEPGGERACLAAICTSARSRARNSPWQMYKMEVNAKSDALRQFLILAILKGMSVAGLYDDFESNAAAAVAAVGGSVTAEPLASLPPPPASARMAQAAAAAAGRAKGRKGMFVAEDQRKITDIWTMPRTEAAAEKAGGGGGSGESGGLGGGSVGNVAPGEQRCVDLITFRRVVVHPQSF